MGGNFDNFKNWWSRGKTEEPATPGQRQPGGDRPREFVEEIKVTGQNLVAEVENLLREGEIRRLRIKQKDRVLLDLPVSWAVVGALLAPSLAAVGAIAAAVSDCTIEVTRGESARPPVSRPAPAAAPAKKPGHDNPDDLAYR